MAVAQLPILGHTILISRSGGREWMSPARAKSFRPPTGVPPRTGCVCATKAGFNFLGGMLKLKRYELAAAQD